jgi:hypothetical protein
VGTVNTTGTSPYAARADHRHAERQATVDRITALEGDRQLRSEKNQPGGLCRAVVLGSARSVAAPADRPPAILDYAAAINIDHTMGRSFAVTASGPLAVTMNASRGRKGLARAETWPFPEQGTSHQEKRQSGL